MTTQAAEKTFLGHPVCTEDWKTKLTLSNADTVCNAILKGMKEQNDEVLHHIFFAGQTKNEQPIEPTMTLNEMLQLIDSGVQQEVINQLKVKALIVDKKSGLLGKVGKFILPMYYTEYSNGTRELQARHRGRALGTIAEAVTARAINKVTGEYKASEFFSNRQFNSPQELKQAIGTYKQQYPEKYKARIDQINIEHAETLEKIRNRIVNFVLNQRIPVLKLTFNMEESNGFVWKTLKAKDQLAPIDKGSRQQAIDALITIAFNGSRAPTESEKTTVDWSAKGINPLDIASLRQGYENKSINASDLFVFSALNYSWQQGGNSHVFKFGLDRAGTRVYKTQLSDVLVKLFRTVFTRLNNISNWTYRVDDETAETKKNTYKPFSVHLHCTRTAKSVWDSNKNHYKNSNGKAPYNYDYLNSLLSRLFESRNVTEWEELTGSNLKHLPQLPDEELTLNFFEFVCQKLWHASQTADVRNRGNLARNLSTSDKYTTYATMLEDTLQSLESKDENFEFLLGVLEEEEETPVVTQSLVLEEIEEVDFSDLVEVLHI